MVIRISNILLLTHTFVKHNSFDYNLKKSSKNKITIVHILLYIYQTWSKFFITHYFFSKPSKSILHTNNLFNYITDVQKSGWLKEWSSLVNDISRTVLILTFSFFVWKGTCLNLRNVFLKSHIWTLFQGIPVSFKFFWHLCWSRIFFIHVE